MTSKWETFTHPVLGELSYYVYRDDKRHEPAIYVVPGGLTTDAMGYTYPAGNAILSDAADAPAFVINRKRYTYGFRVEENQNRHNPGLFTSSTNWDYSYWTESAREQFQTIGRELHNTLTTATAVAEYDVRVADDKASRAREALRLARVELNMRQADLEKANWEYERAVNQT